MIRSRHIAQMWGAMGQTATDTSLRISYTASFIKPDVGLQLRSSTAQNVFFDWGDGTTETVSLLANTTTVITHTFPDAQLRQIKISPDDASTITFLRLDGEGYTGVVPNELQYWVSLESISLVNDNFEFIPEKLADLPNLNEVTLQKNNSLDGVIPNFLFSIPLTTLTFRENELLQDHSISRFDQINRLKDTLLSLNIRERLDQSPAIIDFPDQLGECTLLDNLILASNEQFIPDFPTYHVWFSGLIRIRTLSVEGNYRTVARIDSFIDSYYSMVTANAAMDGLGAWRNVNLDCRSVEVSPTGTYQQPAGYVQGSDNGAPASPKEKLWVLVNQYAHTITYTA
jgi:hypothetical protein